MSMSASLALEVLPVLHVRSIWDAPKKFQAIITNMTLG